MVGPALIAALALVALPGLAGSRTPRAFEPLPDGAFLPIPVSADSSSVVRVGGLDAHAAGAGTVDLTTTFIEPGEAPDAGPTKRARVNQPESGSGLARKPPKDTIKGVATFYDGGTTAMRLPRGTTIVVCGPDGCLERTVNDYGPTRTDRVIDLYRPDFFEICGCPSWSGMVKVTVYVY